VGKGQRLSYQENGESTAVEVTDLSTATAWREGRLVYRHMPLKYVISDVNRYFRQQFVVGDQVVGELPFSGAVLQNQAPSEFLHALKAIFPIETVQTESGAIVIRSRTLLPAIQPTAQS